MRAAISRSRGASRKRITIFYLLEADQNLRHATAAQLAFDLLHPEQVGLTGRADRHQGGSPLTGLRRWFVSLGSRAEGGERKPVESSRAPLIMVAIDLKQSSPALDEALREMTQRVVQTAADARLACVTVMRVARIGVEPNPDVEGRSRHVKRLIALRHWARSLDLPERRITFHVLEGAEAADALIDYARSNAIDRLVMGARWVTGMRRMLGGVSSRVVAKANCTVTWSEREPRRHAIRAWMIRPRHEWHVLGVAIPAFAHRCPGKYLGCDSRDIRQTPIFPSSRQKPGSIFVVRRIKMDPGLTSHSAVESRRDDGAKSAPFDPGTLNSVRTKRPRISRPLAFPMKRRLRPARPVSSLRRRSPRPLSRCLHQPPGGGS